MPKTRVFCKSRTKYIVLNAYSLHNILIDSSTINSVHIFSSSYCNLKEKTKTRDRKRKKELLKNIIDIKMAQHRPRKSAPVEYTADEEDMIVYDVEDELEYRIL
ncbi:hypothetical protein TNCV_3265301 [Trichonephila clavipes]|nr:hypothetical protein TNCV_3265301 [Trichonephila clavipes]